jgi:hypothetical protein
MFMIFFVWGPLPIYTMSYLGCLIFGFTSFGWLHPVTQTPVSDKNIFIYASLIYAHFFGNLTGA